MYVKKLPYYGNKKNKGPLQIPIDIPDLDNPKSYEINNVTR